jgi:hypothetical protein
MYNVIIYMYIFVINRQNLVNRKILQNAWYIYILKFYNIIYVLCKKLHSYLLKLIYLLTLTSSNITLNTLIYNHYDIIKNIV